MLSGVATHLFYGSQVLTSEQYAVKDVKPVAVCFCVEDSMLNN